MSKEEFGGQTAKDVQFEFFLTDLPSRECGRYYFRTAGLNAEPGTMVLFQYDNAIIASAVLERCERFKEPEGPYHGALNFSIESIRVFEPVGPDLLRNLWPEKFEKFSNAKLRLRADVLPVFERHLMGVKVPACLAPQIHDLEPPTASRVLTTTSRIIRDTEISRRVKSLHGYKCQILTCEQFILLPDGARYAEGHHIQPLGEPHNGPDIMEKHGMPLPEPSRRMRSWRDPALCRGVAAGGRTRGWANFFGLPQPCCLPWKTSLACRKEESSFLAKSSLKSSL